MLDLHNSTLVLYRTTRVARHSIHTAFRFCLAALFTLLCLWLGCVLWVVGLFVRQPASLPPHIITQEDVESKAVVPVTPPLPLLQTSCETAIHAPVHMNNNNTTTTAVHEESETGVQETIGKEQQQQQSLLLCTSSLVADKSAVATLTSYSTSSSSSSMASSSVLAPHIVGPTAASHLPVDELNANEKEAVSDTVVADKDMHTSASRLTTITSGNMTGNELLTDELTATTTTHTNTTTMLSDEGQSALPLTATQVQLLQYQTVSEAADTLSVVPTTTTTGAADVLHDDDTTVQQKEEEKRSMSAHAVPRLPLHATRTSSAVINVVRPSFSPSPRSVRTSSARTTTTIHEQTPRTTLCVKEAADKDKSEQVKKSTTTTTMLSTTKDTKADAARTTQLTGQSPRVHTNGDHTEWKNDTPRTSTACNSAREEIKGGSDSTAMTALLQALEHKERALHTLQRDQVRREAQMRRQVHDLQRALSAEQSARVESEEQVNELLAFMPLSGRERDALVKMSARSTHSHGISHKQTATTTTNEAKHSDSSSRSSSDEEDALYMKEGCVVSSIPSASSGRRGTPTSWSLAAHDAFESHAALSSRISHSATHPQQQQHEEEEYNDACSEPQSAKARGSRGKSTGRTSSMSPLLQALSARRQQQEKEEEEEVDEGRLYEACHDNDKKKEEEGKVQLRASRKSARKAVSASPRDCSARTHTTTTTTATNNSTPRQDNHDDEVAEEDAAQEEEGEANNNNNGAVRVPPLLTWPTTTTISEEDIDLPTHMNDGTRLSEGFWQRLRAREERARARVRREFVLQAQARLHQEQSKCLTAEELARRAQREARRATSARESAERSCATLEKKVQELQSQLHECQLQLTELTQRHAGLQSELTSKSEYCTSMDQRLSDYTATMTQQVAEYEARLQEERTQCAQLHKEMTSKEVALQRMSSSNEALQAALHRTLAQAAQAEERARHLLHKKELLTEQQLTQRESELQAWRVRCEQAERSLADCLSKQREELTRVQREAEQRCEAYRLQLSESSVERRSLALRLEHLQQLLQQRQRYDGQSMPYHNIELVDRATLVVRLSAEATALREELHRVCAAREEEKEKALQDYLSLSQEMHVLKQANAQLAMAVQSDANERRRQSPSALRDNHNNHKSNNNSRSVSGCVERGLLTYSAEKPTTTTTTTKQQQQPTGGMATTASVLRSHSSFASSFPSLRSTPAVQRHMPNNNNNESVDVRGQQDDGKEEQADMHNIPAATTEVQTPPVVSSAATALSSALQHHMQPLHEATQPAQPCELTSNTSLTQSGMPYSSITSNDNNTTRNTRSNAAAAALLSSPMSHRYDSLHGQGTVTLVHHELTAQAELPLPRRSALRSLPTNALMISTASTNTVQQQKVRCESEAAELLHKCIKATADNEEEAVVSLRQPSQPYMPLTMDNYNKEEEEDNVEEDEETTVLLRTPSTKTTRKSVPQHAQPTHQTTTTINTGSNVAVEEALHVLTSPGPRPPVMSA